MPLSAWPEDPVQKQIGECSQACFEKDGEGMIQYTATVLGDWTREEVQTYLAQLAREMRGHKKHAYYEYKVVVGQKPL